jgi:hypothetical protein
MRAFRLLPALCLALLAACATPPRQAAMLDDPEVGAWLQARAEALAGGEPVRVEVVDDARVQAEFAPDGQLRVWRGLLLRTRDEAEVTFVLAHEIAHRTLGHFVRRDGGAGWDPVAAEREADAAALDVLRQMGLRADASTSLLSLVAGEAARDPDADAAALALVEQRLEVLWEQVAGAPPHAMRGDDPWRALLDARFERWFAADPAARDPSRAALVREHVRRPAPP